jgi:hypothetical protein
MVMARHASKVSRGNPARRAALSGFSAGRFRQAKRVARLHIGQPETAGPRPKQGFDVGYAAS